MTRTAFLLLQLDFQQAALFDYCGGIAAMGLDQHPYRLTEPERLHLGASLTIALESTCASHGVGTCMNATPLMEQAAANPAISPTTPPPGAMMVESRLAFELSRLSITDSTLDIVLKDSPSLRYTE